MAPARAAFPTKHTITIFSIALLPRLAIALLIFFLNPEGIWHYDSWSYWQNGYNWVNFGTYSQTETLNWLELEKMDTYSQIKDLFWLQPDYVRTPVYPTFLTTGLLTNVWVTIILQILLSSFTVLLTAKLTWHFAQGIKASYFAGLIIALDVPSIFFTNLIMTETLFTFLLVMTVYVMVVAKWKWSLALAGMSLGLAILCRPIAVFLPLALLPYLWLSATPAIKGKVVKMLVLLGVAYTVTCTWVVRNAYHFGTPFLSAIGNFDLFYYHAAAVMAHEQPEQSFYQNQQLLWKAAVADYPGEPFHEPLQFFEFLRGRALNIFWEHPLTILQVEAKAGAALWLKPLRGYIDLSLGLEQSLWNNKASPLALMLVGWQWLVMLLSYPLAVFALWRMWQQKDWSTLLLFGLILAYFTLLTCGPVTDARFRIPAMPFLACLSAIGYNFWFKARS